MTPFLSMIMNKVDEQRLSFVWNLEKILSRDYCCGFVYMKKKEHQKTS